MELLRDLRQAFRSLRRSPVVAVVAVASLAVGIGASSAAFGLIDAIRFRALPFAGANRLLALNERATTASPEGRRLGARLETYRAWAGHLRTVEEMAGRIWTGGFVAVPGGEPAGASGEAVTPNLFGMLGVAPQVGRLLERGDDHAGAEPVAVLGDALARRLFGEPPQALGRTVRISGRPYAVVGVMPPGFQFEFQTQFWIPFEPEVARWADRGGLMISALARRTEAATTAQVSSELATLQPPPPPGGVKWEAAAIPLRRAMLTFWRSYDLAFGAVAAAILLIACANLSGLLLVRAMGRQREFAVRAAIGASPRRLAGTLMAEGALLAGAGGLLGAALARWAVAALKAGRLTLGMLPSHVESGLGDRALPIALALTFLTAILVSLAPALRMARMAPQRFLRGPTLGQHGTRGRRTQYAFVALQIGGAALLCSVAGLGARAYRRFEATEAGFDVGRLIQTIAVLPAHGASPAEAFAPTRERLRAVPGVESVSFEMPVVDSAWTSGEPRSLTIERAAAAETVSRAAYRAVDAAFFDTLSIPLLRGRAFGAGLDDRSPVAVVSAQAASAWWPGEDAIGRRIKLGRADAPGVWRTVVGVVGDALEADPISLVEERRPTVYLPVGSGHGDQARVFVRSRSADAGPLLPSVQAAVRQISPDELPEVWLQRTLYAYVLDPMRRNLLVILAAAACGLFLAAIGTYGVLAHAVEGRRQEIGLRIALSAGRASVARLLLREGAALALVGMGVGTACAMAALRAAQGIFFGGLTPDFPAFAAVGAALSAVILLASAVPLRRALRVDPLTTLRGD